MHIPSSFFGPRERCCYDRFDDSQPTGPNAQASHCRCEEPDRGGFRKGGVGKTTVSVNLAVGLASLGYSVGLMDADVYGPNVPLMMGINRTPMAYGERIQPLEQFGVKLMSMGFLNPGDKPLVWRGPMLHSVIQQFLRGVDWGNLDYLIIDLPPGTGDVQLSSSRRRRSPARS